MTKLTISEVFGPTVQGEGPSMGKRCAFVRLGRCNLDCDFCDTPFTWDWKGKNGVEYNPGVELRDAEVRDVVIELGLMDPFLALVVISGGEPMLQRSGLGALVNGIRKLQPAPRIEIETNGTQPPWESLWRDEFGVSDVWFNVSPKLSSSGVPASKAWNLPALMSFVQTGHAIFKFVVADDDDLDDVLDVVQDAQLPPDRVWIMGVTPFGMYVKQPMSDRFVAEWAIERGFNFTPRLHVQLWGQERGR